MNEILKAADFIREKIGDVKVRTAVILGSGLSGIAEISENTVILPYRDIPGFPTATVPGHKGQLVLSYIKGTPVIFMQGRFHFYEGHSPEAVVFPVRVLKLLGIENIIVTNAAGGINLSFSPGNIMLIDDHINLTGQNPLIGSQPESFEKRFVDMTHAYDKNFKEKALRAADKCGLYLKRGVYVGLTGPSYETPAEIKYLRTIGGDAVGMSTVLEVIAARQANIRVLGLSLITNYGAGITEIPLSHSEVTQESDKMLPSFTRLINEIIGTIS